MAAFPERDKPQKNHTTEKKKKKKIFRETAGDKRIM